MSFSDLKKQSSIGSLTSKLVKEVEKMNNNASGGDDRLWKPEVDKVGNGFAVLRFLPAPDGEDLPWAKMYSHAFQGVGGWYIENSLTTTGQKDPVSEHNRELWNSGIESNKDVVRKQKRKLSYYANVYVVKDPTNPHNEGSVFLYKFGKKIFDKIMEAMQPEFEDETPINPFDFWAGANFKLKIVKKDGYWNYDKSEFEAASPLLSDDDAMEAIWKKQYSLAALTAEDQFKSYEDLERRLKYVLGQKSRSTSPADEETEYDDYAAKETAERQIQESLSRSKPDFNAPDITASAPSPKSDDEDDALSYFQKLAES